MVDDKAMIEAIKPLPGKLKIRLIGLIRHGKAVDEDDFDELSEALEKSVSDSDVLSEIYSLLASPEDYVKYASSSSLPPRFISDSRSAEEQPSGVSDRGGSKQEVLEGSLKVSRPEVSPQPQKNEPPTSKPQTSTKPRQSTKGSQTIKVSQSHEVAAITKPPIAKPPIAKPPVAVKAPVSVEKRPPSKVKESPKALGDTRGSPVTKPLIREVKSPTAVMFKRKDGSVATAKTQVASPVVVTYANEEKKIGSSVVLHRKSNDVIAGKINPPQSKEAAKIDILIEYAASQNYIAGPPSVPDKRGGVILHRKAIDFSAEGSNELMGIRREVEKQYLKIIEEDSRTEGIPAPFRELPYVYAFRSQGGGTPVASYRNASSNGKEVEFFKNITIPQLSANPALVIKRRGMLHKEKTLWAIPFLIENLGYIVFLNEDEKLNQASESQNGSNKALREAAALVSNTFPHGARTSITNVLKAFPPPDGKNRDIIQDIDSLVKKTKATGDFKRFHLGFRNFLEDEGSGGRLSHFTLEGRLKMAFYNDQALDTGIKNYNLKLIKWELSEKFLLFGRNFSSQEKAVSNDGKFALDDEILKAARAYVRDKILRKLCAVYVTKDNIKAWKFNEKETDLVEWEEGTLFPNNSRVAVSLREYNGTVSPVAGIPTISAALARSTIDQNSIFQAYKKKVAAWVSRSDLKSDLKLFEERTKIISPVLGSQEGWLPGDDKSKEAIREIEDGLKYYTSYDLANHRVRSIIDRYIKANKASREKVIDELIELEGERFTTEAPFSWIHESKITKKNRPYTVREWHPMLVDLLRNHIGERDLDRRTRYAIGRLLYASLPEIEHKLLSIIGVSHKVASVPSKAKDATPRSLRAYSNALKEAYDNQTRKT